MLLSICIPTYNRAAFLNQNLRVLVPLVANYPKDVELIISDNASTDETVSVCEGYGLGLTNYHYFQQSENIGSENNFFWLIDHACGKYVYLMGDDDILSPDFLNIVIPYLKSPNDYDSVHWNRFHGDAACNNNRLNDCSFFGDPVEDLTFDHFVRRVYGYPNFISSIIFKKDVFVKAKDVPYSYRGYRVFGQLYWGLGLSNGRSLYYYFPLIIQRNPDKPWAKYWPQYCISSMNGIFEHMETFIPGVFKEWRTRWDRDMRQAIPLVAANKAYYRQKCVRDAMTKYLSTGEKWTFYYYLYFPFARFIHRFTDGVSALIEKMLWR